MTLRVPYRVLRAAPLLSLLALSACRHTPFGNYGASDREFAYIANSGDSTVTILDLVYLRADHTLSVGHNPTALAVNPARDEVYVLNTQAEASVGSLTVINTDSNTVAATIALGHKPTALSVDPAGHRAYVANSGADSVTVVDLDSRRTVQTVTVGPRPSSALISPDGRTLVVTSPAAGSVALFTAAPGSAPGPALALRATFYGCPGATSPVILPNSSKAFIACADSRKVLALSLAANPATADGEWNARQDPTLQADHVLAQLEVGDDPAALTLKPDGGEVFSSNKIADSISELSTQTNEVLNTQMIGKAPGRGVVSNDNLLWIPNTGADSLTLYSIDDGKIVAGIRTGAAPCALAFSADQHLLLAADNGSGDVAFIRTTSKLGPPALFTLMPAGAAPAAIVTKYMPGKH